MNGAIGAVLATVVVLGTITYLGAAIYGTSQVTGDHPEWRVTRARPEKLGLTSETVSFVTSDGIRIAAAWIPAEGARGTVVLAHGNSGNRTDMLPRAAFLAHAGYSVLAVDLRAHGESGGTYMTPGYAEADDIVAALAYLAGRGATRPFAVLGHSYGAVAAIQGGARSAEAAAVIADSGFVSVASMLDRSVAALTASSPWLAAALSLRGLPGLDRVNALVFRMRTGVTLDLVDLTVLPAVARLRDRPLLVIAGAGDPLAVPENARQIFGASTAPGSALVILDGATHRTYELATAEYEAAVLGFLAALR